MICPVPSSVPLQHSALQRRSGAAPLGCSAAGAQRRCSAAPLQHSALQRSAAAAPLARSALQHSEQGVREGRDEEHREAELPSEPAPAQGPEEPPVRREALAADLGVKHIKALPAKINSKKCTAFP